MMVDVKIGKWPARKDNVVAGGLLWCGLCVVALLAPTAAWGQSIGITQNRSFKFEGPNESPDFVGGYVPSSTALVNAGNNSLGTIKPRADWLDFAWKGRIAIQVSNQGPALVDFPIALTLDNRFQKLWSDLNGLDGAEIRLTDSDGTTPLPFWFEDFHNGNDATRSCANISGYIHSATTLGGPMDLDGKTLSLRPNGGEVQTMTFVGNGLTLSQVVSQINDSHMGVLAVAWRGYLRLVLSRRSEYTHETTILPESTALALLKLSAGVYTHNFIGAAVVAQTRLGVLSPCLNLWVRLKTIPTGNITIYLYFNNNAGNLTSLSDQAAVFTYPMPMATQLLLSDVSASGQLGLASYFDNNEVRLGSLTGPQLLLGRDGIGIYDQQSLSLGALLFSTGPLLGGLDSDFTETTMPLSFQGTRFVYPSVRGTNTYFVYAPHEPTTVTFLEWFYQFSPVLPVNALTVELAQGERKEVVFDAVDRNADSILEFRNVVEIRATSPVVVQHRAPAQNFDNHLLYPAGTDLWGVVSTKTHLGAIDNQTEVTIFAGNNLTSSQTLLRGQSFSNGSSGQGTGVMLHVISTKGSAPIGMLQQEDGDGTDSTTFLPYFELGRRYVIPRPAEYITIAATWPSTTCTLRWDSCTQPSDCLAPSSCVDGRCQLSKTSGAQSYPTPNTIYFGLALLAPLSCVQDIQCFDGQRCSGGGCRFSPSDDGGAPPKREAIELSCTERVWAIYEDADTQQERTLYSAKAHRKVLAGNLPRVATERFEGIYNRLASIETPTYIAKWVVIKWLDVGAVDNVPNGTALTYQVNLGNGWIFWDPQTQIWAAAGDDLNKTNTLAELQAHFPSLPNETGRVRFRVVLFTEEGEVSPSIDTLSLQTEELENAPLVTIAVPADPVGTGVPQTIVGRVTSDAGEPVKGLRLTFTVSGPGGSFNVVTGITDENGKVTVSYTPTAPGTHTLKTSVNTGSGAIAATGDLTVLGVVVEPGPDANDGDTVIDASDTEQPDTDAITSPDALTGGDGDADIVSAPDADGQIDGAGEVALDGDAGHVVRERRLSGTTVFGCQQTPAGTEPTPLYGLLLLALVFWRRLRRDGHA